MVPRDFLDRVRERLSKERGYVTKPHAGRATFALAFPNTYYVGMSNLGFQSVYRAVNDRGDCVCERVFIPDDADTDGLDRSGARLFTYESQTPVAEFDVVAFSLSFELDYSNAVRLLRLAGVPPLAADRDDTSPIVIAGGPACTFNPEPMAAFVDAFVIGEAEAVLPELIDALIGSEGLPRAERLRTLSRVRGVYAPSLYSPVYGEDGRIARVQPLDDAPPRVERRWVANLDEHAAVSAILTPETEFSNMALAEVARGCGRHCRFCIAGYAFLPPRSVSAEAVMRGIDEALSDAPEETRVGLVSASVFDHPGSLLVCQALAEKGRMFSISSTRADTLDHDVAAMLRRGGHSTLTIAPEAGTDRMRRVINKSLTEEEIMRAASVAWESGFRRLKLYFMVGLPFETDEDVEGIAALSTRVHSLHKWERLSVSVSCFVPKPWTPFQWAPMDDEKTLTRKLRAIGKALKPIPGVTVSGESAREAVVQGILARGDRRLAGLLLAMSGGDRNWRTALRDEGIDPGFYALRSRDRDEVLPWDVVDLGVSGEYLWQEYERAMEAVVTAPCALGPCRRCGVCHS